MNKLFISIFFALLLSAVFFQKAIAEEDFIMQEKDAIVKGVSIENSFSTVDEYNGHGGIIGFSALKSKSLFINNDYVKSILKKDINKEDESGIYSSSEKEIYSMFLKTRETLSEIGR